jgi:hypothetical protein
MTEQEKFLAEIEAFLVKSGMDHTRFGFEVKNDPAFVTTLRKGRGVLLDTAGHVRAYMAAWKPPKKNPKRAAVQAAA